MTPSMEEQRSAELAASKQEHESDEVESRTTNLLENLLEVVGEIETEPPPMKAE